jgi:hypothetical protein
LEVPVQQDDILPTLVKLLAHYPTIRPADLARLVKSVQLTPTCWLWTGKKLRVLQPGRGGYGLIQWNGSSHLVHRVSWELHYGPIPEGHFVMHLCDVRACLRPSHLTTGLHLANVADAVRKGRFASGDRNGTRTHPERYPRGERHRLTRLTWDEVVAIRAAYAAGGITQRELAAHYGASRESVGYIVRGVTWQQPR